MLTMPGDVLGGIGANAESKRQAHLLKEQGRIAADDIRRDTQDFIGAQRAASPSDASTGSALDIQLATAVEGEIAALRAKLGFDQQAVALRNAGRAGMNSAFVGMLAPGFQTGAGALPLGQSPQSQALAVPSARQQVKDLGLGQTTIEPTSHTMRFSNVG